MATKKKDSWEAIGKDLAKCFVWVPKRLTIGDEGYWWFEDEKAKRVAERAKALRRSARRKK